MNWVDLLIVLFAVFAAISGARQGIITALPAFAGVLIGAFVGIRVAPLLVSHLSSVATRVAFVVAIVILMVALGETLGVWVGRAIRLRITSPGLTGVDNALGAVLQGFVVFVVAWIVALPLTQFSGLPQVSSAIRGSTVLQTVNRLMPPSAQSLPKELRKLYDASGFPGVLEPFAQTPITNVSPPDPALAQSAVVQRVHQSVLKVRAQAPSCSRVLEGSGFVISPHRVMTNAHVVAGSDRVALDIGGGLLDATVVLYDSDTDIAVLAVPDLNAAPLSFADSPATSGENGIVLGYPLDGPYTASSARVRAEINLSGPDIYDSKTVTRDVYTVRAQVKSGNSGGPLIDLNGKVLGVVFGAAVDNSETGFVLTDKQVSPQANLAPSLSQRVSTGRCAA